MIKVTENMSIWWNLPGLHELVLDIAALKEACGLEPFKFCSLLHAKNFVKDGSHSINFPKFKTH